MALRQLVNFREPFGHKAPISEALIDVQFPAGAEVSLDRLREFNATLADDYPLVRIQTEWASEVRIVGPAGPPALTSRHGIRGFLFLSPDEKNVVQVRRDGFTFSRLSPYESWDALRASARVAWDRYEHIVQPSAPSRIALKYINRLVLPAGPLQLQDWFTLYPTVRDGLGGLSDLLLRLALHHPDDPEVVALVTLGTAPTDAPATECAFVLDVDVWAAGPRASQGDLWAILADLHEYKNDVFFGSLTPATFARIRA